MRKIPSKKLSEVWPQGPLELCRDLQAASFRVVTPSDATLERIQKNWFELSAPRSSALLEAQAADFTYVSKEGRLAATAGWGLVFCDPTREADFVNTGLPFIAVEAPDAALDFILRKSFPPEWSGPSFPQPDGVQVESAVVIGPDCEIGVGTVIESSVRIGARVRIGQNCRIGAGTRIADDSVLGNDCELTASVSIGGPGFGFVKYPAESRRRQRRHVGRVVIGDRVRMGAFVAIDRGVFEDTVIGSDSAFDNLVQVAHNCTLGESSTLCAFVAMGGSSKLGDRVTIAGLVGVKDHVKVGNDVTIAAQSGVNRNLESGQVVKGYPPRPLSQALKLQVLVEKLPEFYERLKKLEKNEKVST